MAALYDLSLDELKAYLPARTEAADFDSFWQGTLANARQYPLDAKFEPYDSGLRLVDTYDVTFNGYGGQPIKGWFLVPKQRSGPLPCVVEYIGYGGGRSYPHDWLLFSGAGFAHLIMDTRGQGSSWRRGDTPDIEVDGSTPQYAGFMTRGILSPKTYFYRRVFTDAARAVEAARSNPAVDPQRVAVSGGSQGGGITLAAAYLVPDVAAALPDVPFLCHYRRATELIETAPYVEISRFLKTRRDEVELVFQTLSYFDGVNFSAHAKAKALFSVGLMDDICPPSTVFAAYNHYAGPKQIEVYQYNNHEGGEAYQTLAKMRFLQQLWG